MQARTKLFESYADYYRRGNVAPTYSELSADERQRFELMYGPLLARIPAGGQVLDIGCGMGVYLGWLASHPELRAVGIDGSESQVLAARAADPTLDVRLTDAPSFLKLHAGAFSGVFCMDVLEHQATLDDCYELVTLARASLTNGGFFVCKMPNAANLTGAHNRYIDLTHERAFTSQSVLQLLEAAGFRDCEILPFQAAHLSGRMRLRLEHVVHRLIYRLCGEGLERVFTRAIVGVGWK